MARLGQTPPNTSKRRHTAAKVSPTDPRCAHQTSGVCLEFGAPGQWSSCLGGPLAGVWVILPGFGWGLSRFGCTWKCLEVPPNPSKMGGNAQHRGVPCRSAQQASPAQIRASATTSAPRAPHFGCLCGVCQSRPVDCPSGRNFGRGLGEFLGVWMGFASVWVHVGGVWAGLAPAGPEGREPQFLTTVGAQPPPPLGDHPQGGSTFGAKVQ